MTGSGKAVTRAMLRQHWNYNHDKDEMMKMKPKQTIKR